MLCVPLHPINIHNVIPLPLKPYLESSPLGLHQSKITLILNPEVHWLLLLFYILCTYLLCCFITQNKTSNTAIPYPHSTNPPYTPPPSIINSISTLFLEEIDSLSKIHTRSSPIIITQFLLQCNSSSKHLLCKLCHSDNICSS